MTNQDVDGDDALSYAEYLNLLVALSSTSSSNSNCDNAAALILDHATDYQDEFQAIACHCTEFVEDALASASLDTPPTVTPPCVCLNATTTTTTVSSTTDSTTTVPTIAVPGVYPGAYAVRVCNDIATQLLLLSAECLALPPIYSTTSSTTTVAPAAVTSTTTTAAPAIAPPVSVAPPPPPPSTATPSVAPTPFKSVRVPVWTNSGGTVAIPTVPDNDFPTVRVEPVAASPSSNRESVTNRGNNGLSIALPILVVATLGVVGLLWRTHRQQQPYNRRGVKLEDQEHDDDYDEEEDPSHLPLRKESKVKFQTAAAIMDITEPTEVSETARDYDDDNEEDETDEHGRIVEATFPVWEPEAVAAAATARPHLNLVLPMGAAAVDATSAAAAATTTSTSNQDEENSNTANTTSHAELGVVTLTSSMRSTNSDCSSPTPPLAATVPPPSVAQSKGSPSSPPTAVKVRRATTTAKSPRSKTAQKRDPTPSQSVLMQTVNAVHDEQSRSTATAATAASTTATSKVSAESDSLLPSSTHSGSTDSMSLHVFDDAVDLLHELDHTPPVSTIVTPSQRQSKQPATVSTATTTVPSSRSKTNSSSTALVPHRTNPPTVPAATTNTTTDREDSAAASDWDWKHQSMPSDIERATASTSTTTTGADSGSALVVHAGTAIVPKSPSIDAVPPNRPYLYFQ
jgi:hypothetical protein